MVRKVKIIVHSEDKKINLPSIPIPLLNAVMKTAIWANKFTKNLDDSQQQAVKQGLEFTSAFLKQVKPLWKELNPFTLVEVETEGAFVLIEMR